MGFSDAPGVFLIAGGVALLLATFIQSIADGTVAGVLSLLLAVFGVGAFVLIPTAMGDATAYGPRTCPKCAAHCRVYPWSL